MLALLIDESGIIKSVKPDHTHGNRFVKNKVRAVEQEKIMAVNIWSNAEQYNM